MSAKLIGTREATMERITSESTVNVTIKLDGTGIADISTTVPFYDHMLTSLARHSLMDITIKAHGDTDIDVHHTVVHEGEPEGQQSPLIGGHFTGSMTRHVFESFAYHAGICLHIDVLRGRDPHHIVECQFKALARALRQAIEPDERMGDIIPSTKGAL